MTCEMGPTPFDVESPDGEPDLAYDIERAIEIGTLTPGMAGSVPCSAEIPQPVEEIDEVAIEAEAMARKYGGHPNDYDWRYR